MSKPRLVDLFCGAGGAAVGYARVGFDIYGIDNKPQKHYPFPFLQMDALEAMDRLLRGEPLRFVSMMLEGKVINDAQGHNLYLKDIAAFHASPPCQGYSIMRHLPWLAGKEYPLLIDATRQVFLATGKPYVIENVNGARYRKELPEGLQAGYLCGGMFGLPFYRHRRFETNFSWMQPGHPKHQQKILSGRMLKGRARVGVYERPDGSVSTLCNTTGGHRSKAKAEFEATCNGMQIDWMSRTEITQAIPPAYTEYVGLYLLRAAKASQWSRIKDC